MGKPLIAYSILQAKETQLFDSVAVSSDSKIILETAQKYGADVLIERPAELATDQAPKLPVIRHCVFETEKITGKKFGTIVDLDATSPLRFASDIQEAVGLLEEKAVSNVITGSPARRSPYFNLVETDKDGVVRLSKPPAAPIVRRQDAPKCYDMNASIYVWRRDALLSHDSIFNKDTLLYLMPEERSVDIDSEMDFQIVEFLMKKGGNNF
jgi:N-acylneuraminate cytidylyltransferase/CMP-N,N'-diacetyllegionaminic acid synthase